MWRLKGVVCLQKIGKGCHLCKVNMFSLFFFRMSSLKVSTRVINYEMSNTICPQLIRCKQTFVEDWKSERRSLLFVCITKDWRHLSQLSVTDTWWENLNLVVKRTPDFFLISSLILTGVIFAFQKLKLNFA